MKLKILFLFLIVAVFVGCDSRESLSDGGTQKGSETNQSSDDSQSAVGDQSVENDLTTSTADENRIIGLWVVVDPNTGKEDQNYIFLPDYSFYYLGSFNPNNVSAQYAGARGEWKIEENEISLSINANFFWTKEFLSTPAGTISPQDNEVRSEEIEPENSVPVTFEIKYSENEIRDISYLFLSLPSLYIGEFTDVDLHIKLNKPV
jgi:hypothetical protein